MNNLRNYLATCGTTAVAATDCRQLQATAAAAASAAAAALLSNLILQKNRLVKMNGAYVSRFIGKGVFVCYACTRLLGLEKNMSNIEL